MKFLIYIFEYFDDSDEKKYVNLQHREDVLVKYQTIYTTKLLHIII